MDTKTEGKMRLYAAPGCGCIFVLPLRNCHNSVPYSGSEFLTVQNRDEVISPFFILPPPCAPKAREAEGELAGRVEGRTDVRAYLVPNGP